MHGRWPKLSAPITSPGTILSQTPSSSAASNISWASATAVGERDHVAAEQRELHPGTTLGDAVAHRRHAAGELGDAAGAQDLLLEQRGIALERLVRREHVVVGGDDRDVRDLPGARAGPSPRRRTRPRRARGSRSRSALAAAPRAVPARCGGRCGRGTRAVVSRLRRAIRSVTSATARWTSRDGLAGGQLCMLPAISNSGYACQASKVFPDMSALVLGWRSRDEHDDSGSGEVLRRTTVRRSCIASFACRMCLAGAGSDHTEGPSR